MGRASLPYIHTDWEMLGDGIACWAPMSQLYHQEIVETLVFPARSDHVVDP